MLRDMKHPGHHHEIEAALLEIAGSAKAKGRRYSEEQKNVILKAFRSGMNAFEVHRMTGISLATLQKWRKKSVSSHFVNLMPEADPPKSSGASAKVFLCNDLIRIEIIVKTSNLTFQFCRNHESSLYCCPSENAGNQRGPRPQKRQ
jgi:hypothetical protein